MSIRNMRRIAVVILMGVGAIKVGGQEPSAANPAPAQAPPAQAPPAQASPAQASRAILNKYCVTCHNQKAKTAGLTLDKMNIENVGEAAPSWEKVVRKLRTDAMP